MGSGRWLIPGCLFVLAAAKAVCGQLSVADVAALDSRATSQGWTFKVAPNPATRRPLSELCGLVVPKDWSEKPALTTLESTTGLPSSFDWRTQGGCPSIRDQGGCGSCWAFATVGALECAIRIRDAEEVDLSEQWLLSCNREGYDCSGGWFAHDYHQWKKDSCGGTGAVLETALPYVGSVSSCNCPYPHRYLLESWGYLGTSYDVPSTDALKQAIMKYGPVSVAVYINSTFQAYSGGIFNACSTGTVNHAVVLVGWDDQQGANGVWFVRNSWGAGWGEEGYMRIEYGCSNVGYGACYVLYAGTDSLQVTPSSEVVSRGPVGGPFSPACSRYTLTNTGAGPLDWTATKSQPWLDVAPTAGQLASNASVSVDVCLNAAAADLPTGTYTDTVTFTNASGDRSHPRSVTLKVGQIDYFTEIFDANDNDLTNQVLCFAPSDAAGSYTVCHAAATAFPTDPAGGTPLPLSDDSYAPVVLAGGATVSLYGQRYSSFYVGSNGYVTFTEGDKGFFQTLGEQFRLPRISGLLVDLNPAKGGEVSWKQLGDRVALTFQDVPEWNKINANSFQIEMLFDGRITITWLHVAATSGIAGLSAGAGTPADFVESNLSAYGSCRLPPDYDADGDVDLQDFGRFQNCFSGPNRVPDGPGCEAVELDGDGDVDIADFLVFQDCFNGPNRLRNPRCPM